MFPNPEIKEITLQDYLKIIYKRINLIIVILIIIPSYVAISVSRIQPIYQATVSLLIERQSPKVTKFEEVTDRYYQDKQFYQTQYEILTSRALAELVFEELHLIRDPEFQNIDDPIEALQAKVKVEPLKESQIILIHIEDTDPLRAATIANSYAKLYIRYDIETRTTTTKEAASWLEKQLDDVKKRVEKSEEALNKYIQDNRIVTVPDIEKKSETTLDSLKKDKSKIETKIAETSKRYKEKHPIMIALKAQLEEINKKIEEEINNLLDLNQKMVRYNLLKKEAESNRQLYTSLLLRAKETGVNEKLQTSPIRILDPAKPPSSPIKPQKTKDISRAFIFSLLGGIGLAFLLEYLDSTIHTAEDVSLYVDLPFLGYIPTTGKEAKTRREKNLICFQRSKSFITEYFRTLRTSILFAYPEDKPLKSILITSSLPQEGKTFTSNNIAYIFTQINERVVLIDIDMRRPKIHETYKHEQKMGLSDFLTGKIELSAIIKNTFVPNLSIITAGTTPPNPSELLTSSKIRNLFEELKSRFDRIIVDSPPILSVADTSLLANIVDGVILVIQGAHTRLEAIKRAKNKILEAKGKIIGVVINNVVIEKADRYYYYYYYSEEVKQKSNS